MALNTMKRKTALVSARTTTGASNPSLATAFQVVGKTSSGSGSVTVKLQGSNDETKNAWNDVATITLSLTTSPSSQETSLRQASNYRFYRANATAISRTGAQFDANMGVK